MTLRIIKKKIIFRKEQASVEEISGNRVYRAKKIKMKIIKIGPDLLDFGLPSRSNVAYM